MVSPLDDSILTSVKKNLGYEEDYTDYDVDIINCINTVLSELNERCGIGQVGFLIADKTAKWKDFIPSPRHVSVITYTWMKVKMLFDPESVVGSVLTSYKETCAQIEFTLMITNNTLI